MKQHRYETLWGVDQDLQVQCFANSFMISIERVQSGELLRRELYFEFQCHSKRSGRGICILVSSQQVWWACRDLPGRLRWLRDAGCQREHTWELSWFLTGSPLGPLCFDPIARTACFSLSPPIYLDLPLVSGIFWIVYSSSACLLFSEITA